MNDYKIDEKLCIDLLSKIDQGHIINWNTPKPEFIGEYVSIFTRVLEHTEWQWHADLCHKNGDLCNKIDRNGGWNHPGVNRSKNLRKLRIAQLGSDSIDQFKFSKYVVFAIISQLLPLILNIKGIINEAEKEQFSKFTNIKEIETFLSKLNIPESDSIECILYAFTKMCIDSNESIDMVGTAIAFSTVENIINNNDKLKLIDLGAQISIDALIHYKSPGCNFLYLT